MQCPNCNSENTQRLEVVYEHGTQAISTTSKSVGGGFGGTFGVGGVHTSTSGTSQSTMAQKSAPPVKQKWGYTIAMMVVGLLCFNGSLGYIMFGVALVAAGGFPLYRAFEFNLGQWPNLYQAWKESWVCNKCGTFYRQG